MAKRVLSIRAAQLRGADAELGGKLPLGDDREVLARQARQREPRPPRAQRQAVVGLAELELDLGSVRQLADDVIERVGRRRGGAAGADLRRHLSHHRKVEVGGGEMERAGFGVEADVGEDRDRVAPFDDALNLPQRGQQRAAFYGQLHAIGDVAMACRGALAAARPVWSRRRGLPEPALPGRRMSSPTIAETPPWRGQFQACRGPSTTRVLPGNSTT